MGALAPCRAARAPLPVDELEKQLDGDSPEELKELPPCDRRVFVPPPAFGGGFASRVLVTLLVAALLAASWCGLAWHLRRNLASEVAANTALWAVDSRGYDGLVAERWRDQAGYYSAAVINLDRRPERWARMRQQLAQAGLQASRWEAVDGLSVDLSRAVQQGLVTEEGREQAKRRGGKFKFGYDLTKGAVACALSHRGLWLWASSQDEPLLVLEDDVELLPGFVEEVGRLLSIAPQGQWDVIMLGRHMGFGPDAGQKVVEVKHRALGMFAYIVSPAGARRLSQTLFPISYQLDTELTKHLGVLRVLRSGQAFARSTPSAPGNTDIQTAPGWPSLRQEATKPTVVHRLDETIPR